MPAIMDGPIPGQSLTTEPGNAPWEQPPLYADAQQALAFYLQKLEDEDVMDDALFALSQGFPISTFVESMTTVGVMEGYHTVDVSTLVAPVLHEYLLTIAKAADIGVVENEGPTKDEKKKATEKKRLLILLQKDFGEEVSPDVAKETSGQVEGEGGQPVPPPQAEMAPEAPTGPAPTGLVPRRS